MLEWLAERARRRDPFASAEGPGRPSTKAGAPPPGAGPAAPGVDASGDAARSALGAMYADEGALELGGEKPSTISAHGQDLDEQFVADRPITQWTQPDVSLPAPLANAILRDDPRLTEAWSKWSDHVSKGGRFDFGEEEGMPEWFADIYKLEGASSALPGTPVTDMALSSLAPWEIGIENRAGADATNVRSHGHDEDGEFLPGRARLSDVVDEVPGKDPLTVLACRGSKRFPRGLFPGDGR